MMILVLSMFSIQFVHSANNWWNDDFEYRKEINATNNGFSVLSDFPVYFNISYETNMQADYDDLRFINGDCSSPQSSQLEYEVELYNASFASVWVKIPNFSLGNNSVCMYYGNSTVLSAANPTSVWNTNYGIVYHMDSTGQDSTSNNRDRVADVGAPTVNNTFLGHGLTFDGNDAWSLTNIAYWEIEWMDRVHEIVFETSSDVTTRQTLFAEGGGTNGILMYIVGGELYARWWSESSPSWAGNHLNVSVAANTKYYATMYLSESGNYSLYLDGVLITTLASPDHMDAHSGDGGIAYTGANNKDYHDGNFGPGIYFTGNIYEMRTQDSYLDDNWFSQTSNNILDHSAVTFYGSEQKYYPNISISITSPSTAAIIAILQNYTQEINVTVSCEGKSSTSCGNLSLHSMYNSSSLFNDISTVSGTTPIWSSSSQPQYCLLFSGESCSVSWIVNMTGDIGEKYLVNVLANSNISAYDNITSDNLTIKIVEGNVVSFNVTSYTFAPFNKQSGNRSVVLDVVSSIGNNSNIIVACESGNCSTITSNWTNGINLSDSSTKNIEFECSDSDSGSYSAVFNVTSDEYTDKTLIKIDCEINRVYGPIQINLDLPTPYSIKQIGQNQTFTIKATMDCVGTCSNVSAYAVYNLTKNPFGDSSDGELNVTAANTVVNSYTYLAGNELSGDATITVNDGTDFSIGDEVLIIQMQNGSGIGSSGYYEFVSISNKVGNVLTLDSGLKNDFGSGTFNVTSASATQVVRVPQYSRVDVNLGASITAPAWNGESGGVVVFRASNYVKTLGYINVSEKGFRGGDCNNCGDSAWGDQGEGYLGLGTNSLSANGNGGGGGYGPTGLGGEPGAGGGHAGVGGDGLGQFGTDASGGTSIGLVDLSKLFCGGGAGGGGDNDGLAIFPEYIDGGGIVIVYSQEIIDARVLSKGEEGEISQNNGGTSGAGAGGTIWLVAHTLSMSDVNAKGGASVIGYGSDTGGAGGDGRIRLDYNTKVGASTPASGFDGTFLDLINAISTASGIMPLWTSSSNLQSCVPSEDGSCIFNWNVNASGSIGTQVNVSVFVLSNLTSRISTNLSQYATINITNNTIPTITLISPINASKFIGNGTIEFSFRVDDDDSTFNCSFYLNDVFNRNVSCDSGVDTFINLTLAPGVYNWTINVVDSLSNDVNSTTNHFIFIKDYFAKIRKSIRSINTDLYMVELVTNNSATNSSLYHTELEFVDSSFAYGSFNTLYNWTNSTSGIYNGDILGWDYVVIDVSNGFEINYSVVGVDDYYLRENYRIFLE